MAWWHDVCSLTNVISLFIWRSNWCRCSNSWLELDTTSIIQSTYTHTNRHSINPVSCNRHQWNVFKYAGMGSRSVCSRHRQRPVVFEVKVKVKVSDHIRQTKPMSSIFSIMQTGQSAYFWGDGPLRCFPFCRFPLSNHNRNPNPDSNPKP